MRRAVWVLGVLAVLGVLTSAALAATVSPSRPSSSPASHPPGRQWLHAHGVEVAVPRHGWRLEPASSVIQYAAPSGEVVAQVAAPAVLDAGFCPSSADSSRAFVGLLPPAPGAPRDVVWHQAAAWAQGISGRALGVAGAPTGPRLDLDVPVPPGPCAPTTAHLTLVGRDTGAGVVTLVLVRDVGEPGDLSAGDADAILASMRSTSAR